MGGLAGGAEASRILVSRIEEQFRRPRLASALEGLAFRVLAVSTAVSRAAEEMRAYSDAHGLPGMGSTAVVLVLPSRQEALHPLVLHAGDSLVFRLREDTFKRLCNPHTVETHFGEAARRLSMAERQALTRAIDHRCDARMELTHVDLAPGDDAILCTDGVTGALDLERMGQTLLDRSDAGPEAMASALTATAIEAGGRDNASALVVRLRAAR